MSMAAEIVAQKLLSWVTQANQPSALSLLSHTGAKTVGEGANLSGDGS